MSNKESIVIIPARMSSSRLPGKPMLEIQGRPMIEHVYCRARQAKLVSRVIVATDDARVARHIESIGGEAMMTSSNHTSGSDRLGEVASRVSADTYVNLQGDEPLIRPTDLDRLIEAMALGPSAVASLYHRIDAQEASNENVVKVVIDTKGHALYFSRSLIPFPRNSSNLHYLKHVGVYAYSKEALAQFRDKQASYYEGVESLEQLRLLENGIRIKMVEINPSGPGVDTKEDLEAVRRLFAGCDFDQNSTSS